MTSFFRQWCGPAVGSLALLATPAFAQNTRLVDQNSIGWFTYTGDHKVAAKWAVHTEVQVRRVDFGRRPQQLLLRLGGVYTLAKDVKLGGGYTHFTTYTYGLHPSAKLGEPTPEHRAYEDITFGAAYGRLHLAHRLRLEQRWLGQLDRAHPTDVASWQYQNRARYQLAGTVALQGPTLDDHEWYLTFFDELFIGFGPNVNQNIFNQNRISGGLGYQFTKSFQLELNYLNQWTLQGSLDSATGRQVFENNNGFRLNVVYDLDFTKRAAAD
ncbi:DUF2490 domain-containing protein [Hymenobacter sp. HMF4947]|uniref:DUF2490 domain-containing protein n=1 Tax=Hymenobacter ginkgonis TaxID=2682976 RepID=A0A7K1TEY8_9BACT|nr:DUF2490 domain-containing protein [Hymenobacter ginkgonis]MVN76862.1 DUF2490 domain-containing protein [Hymenobacter ginkgonis]